MKREGDHHDEANSGTMTGTFAAGTLPALEQDHEQRQ